MEQEEYQKILQQICEPITEAERANLMSDNEFQDLLVGYGKILKMDDIENTHRYFHRIYEVQLCLWLFSKNYSRAEILGEYLLKFTNENKKEIALACIDVLRLYSSCCNCAIELQQPDLHKKYREGLCLAQYELENYHEEIDLGDGLKVTRYIGEALPEEEKARRITIISKKAHEETKRLIKRRRNPIYRLIDCILKKRGTLKR